MTSATTLMARTAAALALGIAAQSQAATGCEAPTLSRAQSDAMFRKVGNGTLLREHSAALLRLNFVSPDGPPNVEVLYSAGLAKFLESMIDAVKELRAPCVASAGPVQTTVFRRLKIWADPNYPNSKPEPRLMEQLPLKDLLRISKNLKDQHVRFDFREMSCPFVLTFAPFQPYVGNAIHEQGGVDPSRAQFVKWLESLTLDIPEQMMPTAIGQPSDLYVPCAVLDLS